VLIPRLFLLALIGLAPVLVFLDFPVIQDVFGVLAAALMVTVCFGIRRADAGHLMSECRAPAVAAAVVLIWIVIQLLPLPVGGFSAGTWESAGSALGVSLWSKITVDPGATLVVFCRLLVLIAIAFLAAAVALDRVRAETMLVVLAAACVAMSLIVIVHNYSGSTFLGEISDLRWRGPLAAGSALGTVLTVAVTMLTIERHELRRMRGRTPVGPLVGLLVLTAIGFLLCWLAILLSELHHLSLAAVGGIVVLVIINIVRRLGLSTWSAVMLAALALVAGFAIVSTSSAPGQGPLLLRYAGSGTAEAAAATLRVLSDAGWAGTGAGTFSAVLPIYGESMLGGIPAPNFAVKVAVELGQPMLWLCVLMALGLAALLARGALQRGRDSCHAAAAAGAVVTLVLQAFGDASLASFAGSSLAAVILGLGFGQIAGRSI
jgi:hypothetical protein